MPASNSLIWLKMANFQFFSIATQRLANQHSRGCGLGTRLIRKAGPNDMRRLLTPGMERANRLHILIVSVQIVSWGIVQSSSWHTTVKKKNIHVHGVLVEAKCVFICVCGVLCVHFFFCMCFRLCASLWPQVIKTYRIYWKH